MTGNLSNTFNWQGPSDQTGYTTMRNNIFGNSTLLEDHREISTLTDGQEMALSLVAIFTGTFSVIGSLIIIRHVFRSPGRTKASLRTSYGRIMLALSFSDIISSTSLMMSPFLLPAHSSQRVWASGTDASCSFLGFWTQLANLAYWYNFVLSLFYLLTIRYNISREMFAKRYERYLHACSILFYLISASVGLFIGLYSEIEIGQGCWVGEYPKGCESRGDCIGQYFGWVFSAIPIVLVQICLPFFNFSIYKYVRRTLRNNRRFSINDTVRKEIRRSQRRVVQETATQGFLYVGSFYVSYTLYFVLRGLEGLSLDAHVEARLFPILLLSAFLAPSQGIFNAFIFYRPNYVSLRRSFPELSKLWACKTAMSELDMERFIPTLRSSMRMSSVRSSAIRRPNRLAATAPGKKESEKEIKKKEPEAKGDDSSSDDSSIVVVIEKYNDDILSVM